MAEETEGKVLKPNEEAKEPFESKKPDFAENIQTSQKIEPIPLQFETDEIILTHLPRKMSAIEQPEANVAEAIEEDDSEDEGIEDYKPDGYHAMHIG